jgi:hypothetical protein
MGDRAWLVTRALVMTENLRMKTLRGIRVRRTNECNEGGGSILRMVGLPVEFLDLNLKEVPIARFVAGKEGNDFFDFGSAVSRKVDSVVLGFEHTQRCNYQGIWRYHRR